MVTAIEPLLREQLLDRRQKLQDAASGFVEASEVSRLLADVDAALQRMEHGTYGICDFCHEPVEPERLIADPLTRLCIGHLSPPEKEALEADLELAAQIQSGLLPQPTLTIDGWDVAFHYEPASLVSGDYVDLITAEDKSVHFVLGDVSGKGVAASILMANLQAMFRTLVSINMPLERMLERASSVFCESTLPSHYATIVSGKLGADGAVEVSNAGHLPPLLLHDGQLKSIEGSGLPLGMFCAEQFSVTRFKMDKGDTLFLYTDGLSEARDGSGIEYGVERLARCLASCHLLSPKELVGNCVREVNEFRTSRLPADDLTLMAIQRVH